MKHIHIRTLLCVLVLIVLCACTSKAPQMGMTNGQFAACGVNDDCISSQATNEAHKIAPIKAKGSPEVVMVDLGDSVESVFGGKVLAVDGTYLRAEFKSSLLRTMDDAEFYYDEQAGIIHVHATSRGELFDFDAIRDQIEEVRRIFSMTQ